MCTPPNPSFVLPQSLWPRKLSKSLNRVAHCSPLSDTWHPTGAKENRVIHREGRPVKKFLLTEIPGFVVSFLFTNQRAMWYNSFTTALVLISFPLSRLWLVTSPGQLEACSVLRQDGTNLKPSDCITGLQPGHRGWCIGCYPVGQVGFYHHPCLSSLPC